MMGKKEIITHAVTAVVGIGVGFGIGYLVVKRKMDLELVDLNDQLDEIIQELDAFNKQAETMQLDKPLTPQEVLEQLHPEEVDQDEEVDEKVLMGREAVNKVLRTNGYGGLNEGDGTPYTSDEINPDLIETNTGVLILENPGGENQLVLPEKEEPEDEYPVGNLAEDPNPITAEMIESSIWQNSARQVPPEAIINEDADDMPEPTPDKPYIITVDQYMTDDTHEDNKLTVIYYEEDGILVDEREQRVPDLEGTVGEANLHFFGKGSRDRNTLYVRNDKISADFEILRDPRSYQEAVLGIKPKRESDAPRKMRADDD